MPSDRLVRFATCRSMNSSGVVSSMLEVLRTRVLVLHTQVLVLHTQVLVLHTQVPRILVLRMQVSPRSL